MDSCISQHLADIFPEGLQSTVLSSLQNSHCKHLENFNPITLKSCKARPWRCWKFALRTDPTLQCSHLRRQCHRCGTPNRCWQDLLQWLWWCSELQVECRRTRSIHPFHAACPGVQCSTNGPTSLPCIMHPICIWNSYLDSTHLERKRKKMDGAYFAHVSENNNTLQAVLTRARRGRKGIVVAPHILPILQLVADLVGVTVSSPMTDRMSSKHQS